MRKTTKPSVHQLFEVGRPGVVDATLGVFTDLVVVDIAMHENRRLEDRLPAGLCEHESFVDSLLRNRRHGRHPMLAHVAFG